MNYKLKSKYISKRIENIAVLSLAILVVFAFIPTSSVKTDSYEFASSILAQPTLVIPSFGNSFMKKDFPVSGDREPTGNRNVIATAYSSDPWQTDSTPCFPAINYDLCEAAERGEVNTIAANFLAKGTQVRFPELYGDKIFVVRDRMNARYNGTSRIDFYVAVLDENGKIDTAGSKQSAKNFGLKRVKMEVFGK